MKHSIQLFFITLLLLAVTNFATGQSTKTGNKSSTPEEISMSIIYDLSKKDYATYSNLIISKDELVKLINASTSTSADKDKSLAKVDEASKKVLSDSKKNFDKTITDIESEGIVIEQIKYKSCQPEIKSRNGTEYLNLQITFDFKGNEYTVYCKELLKPSNEWRVTGNLSYKMEQKPTAKITEDTEKDNSSVAPSKICFYTNKGTTLLTEGDAATLRASKDLLVKISFTKAFLSYDKVIVYYKRYVTKQGNKVEVGNENFLVEYKKGDIKNNQDISLCLMKPGNGEPSSVNCNSTAEGRGDFMFWWEQGQYCWFYVTPKYVFVSKKDDLIQGISVVGYKKTGTKTKEYYDNSGSLVRETYPVYDNGTTIIESNDFIIRAAK